MYRIFAWLKSHFRAISRDESGFVQWLRTNNKLIALGVVAIVGVAVVSRHWELSPKHTKPVGVSSYAECPPGTLENFASDECVAETEPGMATALEELAMGGDAKSQFKLAQKYLLGDEAAKDPIKAEYWYRAAIKQGHDAAMNQLARMWADADTHLNEAEEFSRMSLEATPKNPVYLDTLGWIHFQKGKYAEAVQYLELAVSLTQRIPTELFGYTQSGPIFLHLAMAASKAGLSKTASDAYQEAKLRLPSIDSDPLSQFRVQTSVVARISPDQNSGTACVQFDKGIRKVPGVRYEDYVSLEPKVDDFVAMVRGKEICASGLPFALNYKISILPGLPSADQLVTIVTPSNSVFIDYPASKIAFRERGYVLPQYGEQTIPLKITGYDKVSIKILRIPERNLVTGARGDFLTNLGRWEVDQIEETSGSLIFEGFAEFDGDTRKPITAGLSVSDLIGHQLEPGVYIAVAENDRGPETTQWFTITDVGTSLFLGPDGLHVQTRSLNSAKPISDVTVSLVAENNRVLSTSTTDQQGYTRFAPEIVKGKGGNRPAIVVTESKDAGFSFVSLNQAAFDLRDRGVGGRKVPGYLDGYLFSERGIYRPGEDVYLSGIIRDDEGAAVSASLPLTLVIVRPDGIEADRRILRATGGSAYLSTFTLPVGALMGEWDARLYVDVSDGPIGKTSFQVADFVPPKIEVTLEGRLAKKEKSDELQLNVSAAYFFGAAAGGLRARPNARIVEQKNPYPNYPDFRFGLIEEKFMPIAIEISEGHLDDKGKVSIEKTLGDVPSTSMPLAIDVRADVFELGGRVRSARTSVPLRNLDHAIGIKPLFSDDRIIADARAAFEILLLDKDGERIGKRVLETSLYREHRHYSWYRRSGAWDYETYTTDERLKEGSISTLSDGPVTFEEDVKWGTYRLEVRDPETLAISSYRFYAGWGGEVSGPDRPDSLGVKLDRNDYAVGDIAQVFVSPPFAGKLAMILAGKELEFIPAGDITIEGKTVKIPIGEKWAKEPGFYVMPIVYRPGDKSAKQQPGRAVGITWMKLNYEARTLQVHLKTPGEIRSNQSLKIAVETGSTSPETYITVAAVDDAVLGLTGYKSPSPADYFFAQRQLAYGIRDTYGYLINPYGSDRSIISSGGDAAGDRLNRGLTERSSKVVSLFSGVVKTGSDGVGEISLSIPQFSGRLRIMAVAWNATQVGSAAGTVEVRDPVVADLVLPRFLAPGDRAKATATFHNVSGLAGAYHVSVSASGTVELKDNTARQLVLEQDQTSSFKLPIKGVGAGIANISMTINGPGSFYLNKAWKIEVRPTQPVTVERKFVRLKSGETERLSNDVLQPYLDGTATALLSVGSVPSFGMNSIIDGMLRYPYRCLEQTTSRAMTFLFGTGSYPAKGSALKFPKKYKDEIKQAISRLSTLQRRDGGFGLWSSHDRVEPWLSAYATDFLTRAKNAGFRVPSGMLENAFRWLHAKIQSEVYYTSAVRAEAYAHYVLARENRGDLKKLRHFVDTYGTSFYSMEWAFVASALTAYGDAKRALIAQEKTRASSEIGSRYDHYSSGKRQTAALLHLAAETGYTDAKYQTIAFSLAQKMAGNQYLSTQESAWVAMAAHSIETWSRDYKVDANGKLWHGPNPTRIALAGDDLRDDFIIKNLGKDDTVFELSVHGIRSGTSPPIAKGFTIKREVFSENGNPVVLTEVQQGDLFLVRISGKRSNVGAGWHEAQALIVDLLPAGFEIETINTKDFAIDFEAGTSDTEYELQFENGRDDRYVAAIELSKNEEYQVEYIVRAVTPGKFAFPAPYVESMYDPAQFARGEARRVEIR